MFVYFKYIFCLFWIKIYSIKTKCYQIKFVFITSELFYFLRGYAKNAAIILSVYVKQIIIIARTVPSIKIWPYYKSVDLAFTAHLFYWVYYSNEGQANHPGYNDKVHYTIPRSNEKTMNMNNICM